jgi:UDP-2,3-diacylglucosamine hydrolase
MTQHRDKSKQVKYIPDLSRSSELSKKNVSNTCLFISDLHLCASRPHITTAFLSFLKNTATTANTLYVLGDLFEYWAGDDDINSAFHQQIITAFRSLADSGVKIFLMHGNRDFLINQGFCTAAKVTLLKDPTLIELHGQRTLLSHGDDLCTDDVTYQSFRHQVRDKDWQTEFLNLPLAVRKKQIEAIRTRSDQEKSQKSAQIMDVNPDAVSALLQTYYYPKLLIHGHTHRPNQHQIQIDEHHITRWVLGDWYEQGSYLICDPQGCRDIQLNH